MNSVSWGESGGGEEMGWFCGKGDILHLKQRVEQLSRNVLGCCMNRRKEGEEIGFESKVEALRRKKIDEEV